MCNGTNASERIFCGKKIAWTEQNMASHTVDLDLH